MGISLRIGCLFSLNSQITVSCTRSHRTATQCNTVSQVSLCPIPDSNSILCRFCYRATQSRQGVLSRCCGADTKGSRGFAGSGRIFAKGRSIFPAGGRIAAKSGGAFSAGFRPFSKGRSIGSAGYGADFRCRTISIINDFVSAAPSRGIHACCLVLIAKSCRSDLCRLGQITEGRGILPGSDCINAKGRRIGLGGLGPLAKSCGPFFRCLGFLPESRGIAAAGRGPFPKGYRIIPTGHIVSWRRCSVCLLAAEGQGITASSCTILADNRSPCTVCHSTIPNSNSIIF